jgi:hypothetical protein
MVVRRAYTRCGRSFKDEYTKMLWTILVGILVSMNAQNPDQTAILDDHRRRSATLR